MRMTTQKLKTAAQSWAGLLLAGCVVTLAQAQQSITVAAYPAVDEIAKAAVTQWKKKHPAVEVKVVSRAFADHHTAMTTA